MTGRLAAVSHLAVVDAMLKRFGFGFQVWPLASQVIVDLFVLASEIGGASLALELATGVSMRVWAIPIATAIWALLWLGTFDAIEHGVAVLGLVTRCFVVAALALGREWREGGGTAVPPMPSDGAGQGAYQVLLMLR